MKAILRTPHAPSPQPANATASPNLSNLDEHAITIRNELPSTRLFVCGYEAEDEASNCAINAPNLPNLDEHSITIRHELSSTRLFGCGYEAEDEASNCYSNCDSEDGGIYTNIDHDSGGGDITQDVRPGTNCDVDDFSHNRANVSAPANVVIDTPSMTTAYRCDSCGVTFFDDYDHAIAHHSICSSVSNPPAHPTELWNCDICKKYWFGSYKLACLHESICSGSSSSVFGDIQVADNDTNVSAPVDKTNDSYEDSCDSEDVSAPVDKTNDSYEDSCDSEDDGIDTTIDDDSGGDITQDVRPGTNCDTDDDSDSTASDFYVVFAEDKCCLSTKKDKDSANTSTRESSRMQLDEDSDNTGTKESSRMQLDEVNTQVQQNARIPLGVAYGTSDVSINVPGHASGHELVRKLNEHYTSTGQLSKTGHYFEELGEAARQCSVAKPPKSLISWCLDPSNRYEFDHLHQSLIFSLKRAESRVALETGVTFHMIECMNMMDRYRSAHIRNNVNKNKMCKMPIRVEVNTDTNTVTQVPLCYENVYHKEDGEYLFIEEGDEAEEILLKSDNSLAPVQHDGRYRRESSIDYMCFRNLLYQMRAFFHWRDNKEAILSQPVTTFAQLWYLVYMFKLECGLPINELGMSHRSHNPTGINHKIINPEPTIGVNVSRDGHTKCSCDCDTKVQGGHPMGLAKCLARCENWACEICWGFAWKIEPSLDPTA
eukprot:scaffold6599_cov61-Cyclotella_meneghiniana.AAC.3